MLAVRSSNESCRVRRWTLIKPVSSRSRGAIAQQATSSTHTIELIQKSIQSNPIVGAYKTHEVQGNLWRPACSFRLRHRLFREYRPIASQRVWLKPAQGGNWPDNKRHHFAHCRPSTSMTPRSCWCPELRSSRSLQAGQWRQKAGSKGPPAASSPGLALPCLISSLWPVSVESKLYFPRARQQHLSGLNGSVGGGGGGGDDDAAN